MDTIKKTVLLDTSFLIDSSQGKLKKGTNVNIIDAYFPNTKWNRFIHDYVIDESLFGKNKSFYVNNKIHMMSSSHEIILNEFIDGQNKNHFQINKHIDCQLYLFADNNHPGQTNIQQRHTDLRAARTDARRVIWQSLKNASSPAALKTPYLCRQKLKDELDGLIKKGYQISFTKELGLTKDYVLYIKEDVLELIQLQQEEEIIKKTNVNMEKDLPTLYSFLMAERAFECIKTLEFKVKTNKNRKEYITIGLVGFGEITIDSNTTADFQLSLSGLHYCDAFATIDKGLECLLKWLFPAYSQKVIRPFI